MTFDSSTETVAILYDIENAPFEMLDYTLSKAKKYLPCRMIVVSDWEKRPEQKRWNRLMSRPGFTFRQIDRKIDGKNSLDYALFDMAVLLRDEGVRRFFVITTDSDFVRIADILREGDVPAHIIGVGTEQASQVLRDAYDEFYCYPPEKKRVKAVQTTKSAKAVQDEKEAKADVVGEAETKPVKKKRKTKVEPAIVAAEPAAAAEKKPKARRTVKSKKSQTGTQLAEQKPEEEPKGAVWMPNNLQVNIPNTLYAQLQARTQIENVAMDQLITYLLMRGLRE